MTQETLAESLQKIQILLIEMKTQMDEETISVNTIGDWIPRSMVQDFLNYGSTKMAALEHDYNLVVSKVGGRKFYHKASLIKLLEDNVLY